MITINTNEDINMALKLRRLLGMNTNEDINMALKLRQLLGMLSLRRLAV